MRSLYKALFLFFIVLALIFLFFFSSDALGRRMGHESFYKDLGLFTEVMGIIKSDYVEDVGTVRLVEGALKGMLRSLDPYSQYLDAGQYEDLKIDTSGEFAGLGLEVSDKRGVLHVITPLDGSPAEQAGVKPGDAIIKIDGLSTRDLSLAEAVRKMRGQPGTAVVLTLMREGENQWMEIKIPRARVEVKSIREAKRLESGVGYIRLSAFQEKSGEDLARALLDLKNQDCKGLILDVRNNSGGLLTAAVDVAEQFVPEGKVIVSTKGRHPRKSATYVSKNKAIYSDGPLVVLVNKGSASGAEILAGAIQDHGLGRIVGSQTFGKGSIQSLVPLPGGAALRLTTSRYYTPKGRLIHEKGITPDIVVEPSQEKNGPDRVLLRALEAMEERAQ